MNNERNIEILKDIIQQKENEITKMYHENVALQRELIATTDYYEKLLKREGK